LQIIHDDLLHPVLGGNKLRKLDALLPALVQDGVTDVVCAMSSEDDSEPHIIACARLFIEPGICIWTERAYESQLTNHS